MGDKRKNFAGMYVAIMLLAQDHIYYAAPVRDPWFMATTPFWRKIPFVKNQNVYGQDNLIRVLNCADQFQLCTQAHIICTFLTGIYPLINALFHMSFNNDVQRDILLFLCIVISSQPTSMSVNYRVKNALRVSNKLSAANVLQTDLFNNQWTIESAYWFDIWMANLQQIIDFVIELLYFNKITKFVSSSRNACERQKIHNTANDTFFSMFGIFVILNIDELLIFIFLVFDSVVEYFRKIYGWKDYKRLQRIDDELLKLERLAYPIKDVLVQEKESSEGNTVSQANEENAVSQNKRGTCCSSSKRGECFFPNKRRTCCFSSKRRECFNKRGECCSSNERGECCFSNRDCCFPNEDTYSIWNNKSWTDIALLE